jgi:hypothetical protein
VRHCFSLLGVQVDDGIFDPSLLRFLDVGERPGFFEDGFLGSVETEEELEALAGFGWEPVGVPALWGFGANVEVGGAVGVGLYPLRKRGAAAPRDVAHAPDDGFDGAALDCTLSEIFRRESLSHMST